MEIPDDLRSVRGIYLTIGVFDGVHRGHQEVITRLVKEAETKGREKVLLTFDPHPLRVIDPQREPILLISLEEKERLIFELGIKRMIVLPFDLETAQLSGEEFIRKILLPLKIEKIFIGENYLFSREREGDVTFLRKMGASLGFEVEGVLPLRIGGDIVSSTRIRESLLKGKIHEARELLGRPLSRRGQVVPGEDRGKTIGYPTANLDWDKKLLLPKNGVYAVYIVIDKKRFAGMANIGQRPTFKRNELSFEVHLFDFNEDIYGYEIEVVFIERIREEITFDNPISLKIQLERDEQISREILVAKEGEV